MTDANTKMLDADFQYYQKMLLEKSGLALTPEKTYLLTTRLTPLAQQSGFTTLEGMTSVLRSGSNPKLLSAVIEAMTTNETSFFRDTKPFQHLKDIVFPFLMKKNQMTRTIKLWSAACSTGQEPYSIAMMASEFFKDKPGWRLQIFATDLSDDVLKQAQSGVYNQFEIQRGLHIQMIMKHFTQNGTNWVLKDDIRNMVSFKNFNLLDKMTALGPFDIIFCRNVLIYFNAEMKRDVLVRMSERLQPAGFLFLGACETVLGLNTPFQMLPGHSGLHAVTAGIEEKIAALPKT